MYIVSNELWLKDGLLFLSDIHEKQIIFGSRYKTVSNVKLTENLFFMTLV